MILHYLYNYLKATYTTKVERDVARFHHEKYQEILEELKKVETTHPTHANEFLPNKEVEELQSSLFEFVQTIL
jgi:hypothetical protein